jgi:hypothetical protein
MDRDAKPLSIFIACDIYVIDRPPDIFVIHQE